MRILVIAAHPDDEVLGCGGTMARLSEANDVRVVILGEGATSRCVRKEETPTRELERLRDNARAASQVLGVRSVDFQGLPDNRFDELPLLEIIKGVERWVAASRPDVIYTHHPGDLNRDHGLTYRAVLTATRPGTEHSVRDLFSFEIPSSTEWAYQTLGAVFRPTVFVDIGQTLDRKLAAMACYESEVRDAPHPRSLKMLEVAAARWGSVAGIQLAEPFELIRSIR
jgi:LmbE family N-acetylglucosaminyl deacetylase